MEASPNEIAVLRAYVGDKPTWRNPQHPWKVDPRFKLIGLPTLIHWEHDAIKRRLENREVNILKIEPIEMIDRVLKAEPI